MSNRDVNSSRWYIPLVASTEVVRRSGDLTTFDPGNTIGTLPTAPVTPMASALLWIDSSLATSIFKTGDRIHRVRDRSGNENSVTQDNPAQKPKDDVPGFNFTD